MCGLDHLSRRRLSPEHTDSFWAGLTEWKWLQWHSGSRFPNQWTSTWFSTDSDKDPKTCIHCHSKLAHKIWDSENVEKWICHTDCLLRHSGAEKWLIQMSGQAKPKHVGTKKKKRWERKKWKSFCLFIWGDC